ncbi:MAG: peptide chain release factor N(5)-glutamine methyltransferase [Prevotella sp.]|nr:peptide chain release factor N(5)-glutamine methyltransferase [Prevotella sp.]
MDYSAFWKPLTQLYEAGEAKAIARLVMEVRFGLSMTDILCGKVALLPAGDQQILEDIQQRLLAGEPVQYVLGQAAFGGHTFYVAPGVLIPRPETEELCRWVVEDESFKTEDDGCAILDIGTGSGCIACTLAAALPQARVTAWDISDDALRIAAENARRIGVNVTFEKTDILNCPPSSFLPPPSSLLPPFSLIVSNPPYICNKERATMDRNVLEHEPEQALFVPDDDPLLFYRAIARYAVKALRPGGMLFFEINPLYVGALQQMLRNEGFASTEVRTDQFGKKRFTKSWL